MEMEGILGVFAGYSLDLSGSDGVTLSQPEMAEVLTSALNELEYCMGLVNTTYGALRAEHGHHSFSPSDLISSIIGNRRRTTSM